MSKNPIPYEKPAPLPMRLNKYIANSGAWTRKQADKFITEGQVKVNGKVIKEMGVKVTPGKDQVLLNESPLQGEAYVYVLLNKPKNTLTSGNDPDGKPTVMSLTANACKERIHAVGRLDKEHTGLILLTNDSALSKRLSHPDHEVEKLFHITLDRTLEEKDLKALLTGVTLDDGEVKALEARYVGDEKGPSIGLRILSSRNRVVLRIFKKLGYKIQKMDRVMFAGLNKKALPRGRWRHLTPNEVSFIRMATR